MGKGYNSSYEVHFWPRETSNMVVFASVREEENLFALKNLFFWGGGGEKFHLIQFAVPRGSAIKELKQRQRRRQR